MPGRKIKYQGRARTDQQQFRPEHFYNFCITHFFTKRNFFPPPSKSDGGLRAHTHLTTHRKHTRDQQPGLLLLAPKSSTHYSGAVYILCVNTAFCELTIICSPADESGASTCESDEALRQYINNTFLFCQWCRARRHTGISSRAACLMGPRTSDDDGP